MDVSSVGKKISTSTLYLEPVTLLAPKFYSVLALQKKAKLVTGDFKRLDYLL